MVKIDQKGRNEKLPYYSENFQKIGAKNDFTENLHKVA